jgi:hypothetical protein
MANNVLEMDDNEALAAIEEVALKMSRSGDHNNRIYEKNSVMKFILDKFNSVDEADIADFNKSINAFIKEVHS